MSNEKLLVNIVMSNNFEDMSNKQIEELATGIYTLFRSRTMSRALAHSLYDKGWRKQSEGEWISVEDGEPEEATNVLCVENDNYYLAFLEDGVWFDCVAYYRDDTFTQVCPTHWMPLPEAPKMKGGDSNV